jgi:hypothetical protein
LIKVRVEALGTQLIDQLLPTFGIGDSDEGVVGHLERDPGFE